MALMLKNDDVDEINPEQNVDRILYNTVNTSTGFVFC